VINKNLDIVAKAVTIALRVKGGVKLRHFQKISAKMRGFIVAV